LQIAASYRSQTKPTPGRRKQRLSENVVFHGTPNYRPQSAEFGNLESNDDVAALRTRYEEDAMKMFREAADNDAVRPLLLELLAQQATKMRRTPQPESAYELAKLIARPLRHLHDPNAQEDVEHACALFGLVTIKFLARKKEVRQTAEGASFFDDAVENFNLGRHDNFIANHLTGNEGILRNISAYELTCILRIAALSPLFDSSLQKALEIPQELTLLDVDSTLIFEAMSFIRRIKNVQTKNAMRKVLMDVMTKWDARALVDSNKYLAGDDMDETPTADSDQKQSLDYELQFLLAASVLDCWSKNARGEKIDARHTCIMMWLSRYSVDFAKPERASLLLLLSDEALKTIYSQRLISLGAEESLQLLLTWCSSSMSERERTAMEAAKHIAWNKIEAFFWQWSTYRPSKRLDECLRELHRSHCDEQHLYRSLLAARKLTPPSTLAYVQKPARFQVIEVFDCFINNDWTIAQILQVDGDLLEIRYLQEEGHGSEDAEGDEWLHIHQDALRIRPASARQ